MPPDGPGGESQAILLSRAAAAARLNPHAALRLTECEIRELESRALRFEVLLPYSRSFCFAALLYSAAYFAALWKAVEREARRAARPSALAFAAAAAFAAAVAAFFFWLSGTGIFYIICPLKSSAV